MATNASELRELHDAELLDRVRQLKEELFNLRFQHATGQLDNVERLGALRRDIARCHTLVREREIAAAEELAAAQGDEPEADTRKGRR